MQLSDPAGEGERILTICNACRYCEGYCAVFPAMERRLTFSAADLNYLANLCHNCGECFYACPYAPPHDFAVNVPKTLAEIRVRSYENCSWPAPFRAGFRHSAGIAGAALALSAAAAWFAPAGSDFYEVIPHGWMVALSGAAGLLAILACGLGVRRLWRTLAPLPYQHGALRQAFSDALTMRYLGSGGAGCPYPGEPHSQARRWFHHCTFYGFMLCLASTSIAAFYDSVLGLRAPYPYFSLPVVLGTLGGLGLLAGPFGLYRLMRQRDPATDEPGERRLSSGFLWMLLLTSLTGLALLGLRQTAAMPALLVLHLGIVMALFLSMPYGKFVHGLYRFAALIRYAMEQANKR